MTITSADFSSKGNQRSSYEIRNRSRLEGNHATSNTLVHSWLKSESPEIGNECRGGSESPLHLTQKGSGRNKIRGEGGKPAACEPPGAKMSLIPGYFVFAVLVLGTQYEALLPVVPRCVCLLCSAVAVALAAIIASSSVPLNGAITHCCIHSTPEKREEHLRVENSNNHSRTTSDNVPTTWITCAGRATH